MPKITFIEHDGATHTVDAEIGSADWNQRVAASKFAPHPQFAKAPSGVIVLQDHSNPVWFRAIRIRRL
mgnify:CR=1 FL=1